MVCLVWNLLALGQRFALQDPRPFICSLIWSSIIHPFNNSKNTCEYVLYKKIIKKEISIGKQKQNNRVHDLISVICVAQFGTR